MATQAHQQGKLAEAENLYRQILKDFPGHHDTLHLLGLACRQLGKYDDAQKYLSLAVKLKPENPVFCNNLGETLKRRGFLKEAIEFYQKALQINPGFAEAHYNLAIVLKETGNLNSSIEHYQNALQFNPNHSQAYYNLGNIFLEQGRFIEAMENYKLTLQINSKSAEAHNNLGITYREFNRMDEAISHYQHAIELKPDFQEAHRNLAVDHEAQGKIEQAKIHYQKLQDSEPENLLFNLNIERLCTIIPSGNYEIDNFRENLLKRLDKYVGKKFKIDWSKVNDFGGEPPSILIYQGLNDKNIKIKYAEIFKNKLPDLGPSSATALTDSSSLPRHPKPRIGFVVTSGHEGVFLTSMKGILNNLSGEQFCLKIVCGMPNGEKIISPAITNSAIEYLNLPARFDQAVETIRNANFDIIYYWEVGTDVTNYFLPYFQLAPVQCTSWGWHVTSGIPQMNYFISSEHMEIPEADSHYTEKLVRFKNLPVYYYRPHVPEILKSRNNFGLEENSHIYLCAQNLRKVHPDFDKLVAEILRRDQDGILLFIEDKYENVTNNLKKRLQANYPDIIQRIHFIKRMAMDQYLNLIALSDVCLDTLYYNGANTSYDAFACGVPVVTLPSKFSRGRYTFAAYRQMNVPDCIADNEENYIYKAVKLGTDHEYRKAIKAKIISGCPLLFEDIKAVEEMTEFFQKVYKNEIINSITLKK
jgi:protein O-GlcNAc transferase